MQTKELLTIDEILTKFHALIKTHNFAPHLNGEILNFISGMIDGIIEYTNEADSLMISEINGDDCPLQYENVNNSDFIALGYNKFVEYIQQNWGTIHDNHDGVK